IYTLSLHDALPIFDSTRERPRLDEARSNPVARATSDTIRRASPFRVNSPHSQSRTDHLAWRSNDVGRRAMTVRRVRGETVSGRRATVSSGSERAEEKKV